MQELLSLLGPICLFLFFISIALGDWCKKTFVWFMSENVLPMFSSGSFMRSHLMFVFKPFWVNFCVGCGGVLTSLIYMWLSCFPNTTSSRDYLSSIIYSCLLHGRLTVGVNLFLAFVLKIRIMGEIIQHLSFCLTYFTRQNTLKAHPWCHTWKDFICYFGYALQLVGF